MIRRRTVALTAVLGLVLGAGPTVGDVGSCGDQATSLDLRTFQAERKAVDCQRCKDCGLMTQTCTDACNPRAPSNVTWPSTCYPLAHDGIVCIDALQAASCDAYATYVDDGAPALPTECDFCHDIPEAGPAVGEF